MIDRILSVEPCRQPRISSSIRKLALPIGVICIALGLLFNKTFLEQTIAPNSRITSSFYYTILLSGQIGIISLGIHLVVKRQRTSSEFLLAIISAFFCLILGGVLLQVFYTPPTIVSGWKSFVSKFERNQLGFRGHRIEYASDDFVIVLLGDSMVQAQACAYGWMPERRLEHHLKNLGKKVRVFTVAAQGYGQDQQLLAMREYYRNYRADLVILWETPLNDIWNNMFPTHYGLPKPTFWLQDGQLKGPTEDIGEALPSPAIKLVALVQRFLNIQTNRDEQWENFLPSPYKPLTQYSGPVNYDWEEQWNARFGSIRDDNFENDKNHKAMFFTPPSDRMRYGLELTRKLFDEIKILVSHNAGKFAIFTPVFPSTKASSKREVYRLKGKYYVTSQQQFDDNLNYLNRSFQSYMIPVTVEDWQVSPENRHTNEHATDQVMKDLAKAISNLIS